MAKIIWGLAIILAISLGIAIYAECYPGVLQEEAICPGKEDRVDRLIQELRDEDRHLRYRAA